VAYGGSYTTGYVIWPVEEQDTKEKFAKYWLVSFLFIRLALAVLGSLPFE
jgi:hypothetical protein